MSSKYKIIPVLLLIVLSIYKCTSALYKPNFSDAQKSGISIDTLMAGRKRYIGSCGSCHSLYLPKQYTKAEWRKNMDSMQVRSNITVEQKEVILKYLESTSKD